MALADVQRRRFRHHDRRDRTRSLAVAGRPRAATGEGGAGGRALKPTFCVVAQSERFNRFLADQLSLSRTQAGRLIADKRVTARGKPLRASAVLERGTEVTVELADEAPPRSYTPFHADLRFVFEDEHLAVLDKPAGPVRHPRPRHPNHTLVNV